VAENVPKGPGTHGIEEFPDIVQVADVHDLGDHPCGAQHGLIRGFPPDVPGSILPEYFTSSQVHQTAPSPRLDEMAVSTGISVTLRFGPLDFMV
jgi:hypothetical protein